MGRELAQRAAQSNGRANGNGNGGETPTLAKQIERMMPEYQKAMPKGREAAQIVRDAITCLRNVKHLDECEANSVLGALMTCAQLDLRPGVLGHAWPLPFWDNSQKRYRAQLVIGYQGYIELGHRSGRLKDLAARIVYKEDPEFDYWLDEEGPHLIHRPLRDGMRETIRSFYSIARLVNGGVQITEPVSVAMMEAHRERYAPRNQARQITGPWKDHFGAMGRKTVVLQNFRLLPKTEAMVYAMEVDDGVRVDLDPEANPAEVTEHRVVPSSIVDDDPVPPDDPAADAYTGDDDGRDGGEPR